MIQIFSCGMNARKHGMTAGRIVALAAVFGSLPVVQAQAHEHTTVDLTGVISSPTKINNVGDILGSGMDGTTPYPALLHNGVLVRLPALNPPFLSDLPNSFHPNGYHLNNNSQILYYGYTNGVSGDISSFVFDAKTGVKVDIGKIPGYTSTIGVGLNDSGDVVGFAYSSPTIMRPFLYHNGQFSQLAPVAGAPAGAVYTYSFINNHGDVLGYMTANGVNTWLIWRNGVPASFIAIPKGANDYIGDAPIAFNDNDVALVSVHDYFYNSFLYHVVDVHTAPMVDNFIGAFSVEPLAFNNLGNVLYRSRDTQAGHFGTDWVYSISEGRITSANSLVPTVATDINDNVDILGAQYMGFNNPYKDVVIKALPAPAPQITGLTPDRTIPGAPSIPVTINGTGFDPDSTVLLNGAAQASSHYLSATQMRVVMPASLMAQPGIVAVKVMTPAPGGGSSITKYFNVAVPRATITDPGPYHLIPYYGAQSITINGLDFDPGAVLTINDTYTITPTSVTPYQLTATVPTNIAGVTGKYFVRVVNPGWSNASAPVALLVAPPSPIINLISPNRISAGLTSLKLSIYGPYDYRSTLKVSFNGGAPVTPDAITGARITVAVPASILATPGNVAVRLVDTFENGGSSAPVTLVVSARPTLTSLTPNSAAVGSGAATMTLTGTNFEASSTVTINNGTPIAPTFVSSTQLTVTVPSSVTAVKGGYAVRVVNTGYSNFSNPQTFTVTP